jgi:hypothetical protein
MGTLGVRSGGATVMRSVASEGSRTAAQELKLLGLLDQARDAGIRIGRGDGFDSVMKTLPEDVKPLVKRAHEVRGSEYLGTETLANASDYVRSSYILDGLPGTPQEQLEVLLDCRKPLEALTNGLKLETVVQKWPEVASVVRRIEEIRKGSAEYRGEVLHDALNMVQSRYLLEGLEGSLENKLDLLEATRKATWGASGAPSAVVALLERAREIDDIDGTRAVIEAATAQLKSEYIVGRDSVSPEASRSARRSLVAPSQVHVDRVVKEAQSAIGDAMQVDGKSPFGGTRPADGLLGVGEAVMLPGYLQDNASEAFEESGGRPVDLAQFEQRLKGEAALYAMAADTNKDWYVDQGEAEALSGKEDGADLNMKEAFDAALNGLPHKL